MGAKVPTREQAFALLLEFNTNESLVKHALAVEAVMRYMARRHSEDEDKWGIIGLIHDLDYEKYPGEHCTMTQQILRTRSWPDEYIRAAVSHGWGICSDVEPQSLLEITLFAVDELTGLVIACALVRPSKSVMDITPKSVRAKWKQKAFAAGVNREVIEKGAGLLGIDIDILISDVIAGLREVAPLIGLA
jgi:predicted hydrolase (HD superfamily)